MSLSQTPELFWLAMTATATGLMWAPHILQLIFQEGLLAAVYDPAREIPHRAAWARRAQRAHSNAVENLAVFAPLVLLRAVTGSGDSATAVATALFFFARLGHFLAYSLAIPVARVLLFLIGWACQMTLAFALFGWL